MKTPCMAKSIWGWSLTSTGYQPVMTSLTLIPFLKVCWASRTFLGLLFLLKRVVTFHCILNQLSIVVATQSSTTDVWAATSTAHSLTDLYSAVLIDQSFVCCLSATHEKYLDGSSKSNSSSPYQLILRQQLFGSCSFKRRLDGCNPKALCQDEGTKIWGKFSISTTQSRRREQEARGSSLEAVSGNKRKRQEQSQESGWHKAWEELKLNDTSTWRKVKYHQRVEATTTVQPVFWFFDKSCRTSSG